MDAKTRIEELEKARAKRIADLAEKELSQRVSDLEAREALEAQHGTTAEVKVPRYAEGYATAAFVRTPTGAEYKRYVDMTGKAHGNKNTTAQRDAFDLLAKSCWVYPETDDARKAMLDRFPGILTAIGLAATALAEGKVEEEGKG